jgi:hypothetical protein
MDTRAWLTTKEIHLGRSRFCSWTGSASRRALGALSLFAILLLGDDPIFAQMSIDDDQPIHIDGLIPDSEEQLKDIPRTPTYRAFLPSKVDLSNFFPTPGNQGGEASCVGWAVGYAARAYYAHIADGRDVKKLENIPSPAYIYNSIKAPGSCTIGTQISQALNLLRRGAVSLKEYPYFDGSCSPPDRKIALHATDFRIDTWMVVDRINLDQIKAELYQKNPVILSIRDSTGFQHLGPGQIYKRPGKHLGWHALTAVGYDEDRQAFKLINSWGRNTWGDGGFGWIGYEAFRTEVDAAYVMRVSHAKPGPVPSPVVVVPRPQPPKPSPVVVVPAPQPPKPPQIPVAVLPPSPTPIDLPALNCGRVRVVEHAGKLQIVGYVDLEQIRAAAVGADLQIAVRPWPQCEALETLEKPLTRSDADRPNVKIRGSSAGVLTEGDDLVFEIETPSYLIYLHVAYMQADGTVLNLVQPDIGSFKAYAPHSKLVIGNEAGERHFRVSAPYGREMLLVLAGRSPIFPDARPNQETERKFLTALRRALVAKPDATAPDRDVTAGYDTIVTAERKAP